MNPFTPRPRPADVNPWLVAIAVMSSTFMEVLDTTVVNVSLPHIAGSLSATIEETTWTLTSYLVANAIILPMTGWLASAFGRKRLLLLSVVGFTVSSFFCGLAPSLPFLVVFRIVQGACGGGLQPLSQAILLEAFPPEKRGQAMAFWALGIVVAPMLGPVAGGWLTDNYSWRWVFYINVPIGFISILLTQRFVFDPSYLRQKIVKVDYWGILLLVLGIACLQIMLDKGQEEDWFSSRFIVSLAALAAAGLTALIIRELMTDHPIIDLGVFRYKSYAIGTFLMTILGFVLYGSTVLLPLLMQVLLGYTATHAGVTNLPRGLASFLIMPVVGRLTGKMDARKMLAIGLTGGAIAMYQLAQFNLNVGFWNFWWPLIVQGAALGFIFVPLTTVTNNPIPKERLGNATSLFNLMRNLGASIGIALVQTYQFRKQQTHINILGGHVNPYSAQANHMIDALRGSFLARGADAADATRKAYDAMWGIIQRQAAMLSYNDTFLLLALLFVAMLPLLLLLRRPKTGGGPVMAH
ncbi:MAG TPA: DHA2 family efflux MFS transporter permease subunit [Bryobacteraceae bacterium]|jgi:DHA2 family multidrug resistance protein|nr:DHA2 family efflux MFS transporter permease subunit [Bryobacteraceae bacterium]